MTEHHGGVTIKGSPLTTIGEPIVVGRSAPEFVLTANDMSKVTLADSADKVRLISVVPSLDTGICHAQTKRFNDEVLKYGDKVAFLTVSAEHPFNQRRWVAQESCSNIPVVSDALDLNFGYGYGVAIKEWRLLQRSIFVIDSDGKVAYTEYIPEIAQFPNYEAALSAVDALLLAQ